MDSLAAALAQLDPNDPKNSFANPTYTYTYDKYSCVRAFYFIHIFFAYMVALTGLCAFITRVYKKAKWTHKWFGRSYIISMLWCTATSLLINNTGLPSAVLWSFLWVLGGMCVAWIIINFHQAQLSRRILRATQERIKKAGLGVDEDLEDVMAEERDALLAARNFKQRFFSYKAAHGIIMTVSYFNIVGRIFASNQSGDFTCHTYPVYKPINTAEFNGTEAPLTLVPTHNPNYDDLPWSFSVVGWALMLLFAPMLLAVAVGATWSYYASRNASAGQGKGSGGARLSGSSSGSGASPNVNAATEI